MVDNRKYDYDSVQECADEVESDLAAAEAADPACARAVRALYNCYLSADRGMCMDYDDLADACEDEYNAYYDACEG